MRSTRDLAMHHISTKPLKNVRRCGVRTLAHQCRFKFIHIHPQILIA